MKATPKLQDTLEVFVDQIEDLKGSISQSKAVAMFLTKRIEELKMVKIEPDLKQFNDSKSKMVSDFERQTLRVADLLEQNYLKLDELQRKRNSSFSSYPLYLLFAFFIAAAGIYFGISNQKSKSQLQEEYNTTKSYSNSLEKYIKESKQIDMYNKWLEKSESK
ncbi:hypothetical protein ACK1KB_02950 [Chryseobacterium sp. TY3]